MYRISKKFHFSASHQLSHLDYENPCKQLHGHNYIVEIVLESEELDGYGFVRDFGELSPLRDFIDEKLDHRHLDDILDCPSTSENIARYLYEFAKGLWPEVAAVRVSETPGTWAEYRP